MIRSDRLPLFAGQLFFAGFCCAPALHFGQLRHQFAVEASARDLRLHSHRRVFESCLRDRHFPDREIVRWSFSADRQREKSAAVRSHRTAPANVRRVAIREQQHSRHGCPLKRSATVRSADPKIRTPSIKVELREILVGCTRASN